MGRYFLKKYKTGFLNTAAFVAAVIVSFLLGFSCRLMHIVVNIAASDAASKGGLVLSQKNKTKSAP